MSASGEIGKFNKRLDELVNSKYLLADGKISEVLKSIASSELLFEIFAHVTDGFDYALSKGKSFYEEGGKGSFSMPEKDEDKLALVFSLLYEIDDRKEDLFALCNRYFYSAAGNQTSYENFCALVLIPFGETVNKTAYKLINADYVPKTRKTDEDVKGLKLAVKAEKKRLSAINITSDQKSEAEFVLDKLLTYAEYGDAEAVGVAFIAIKYMNKSVPNLNVDTDGIIAEIQKINL